MTLEEKTEQKPWLVFSGTREECKMESSRRFYDIVQDEPARIIVRYGDTNSWGTITLDKNKESRWHFHVYNHEPSDSDPK